MIRLAIYVICLAVATISVEVFAAGAPSQETTCVVMADGRVEEPLRAIVDEYVRRTNAQVQLKFCEASVLNSLVRTKEVPGDLVVVLGDKVEDAGPVSRLHGATKVAWKHPGGQPVWAAAISDHPRAPEIVQLLGSPTGHQLWSKSRAGFTIVSGRTHADAIDWMAENRLKHTYPMTAARILGELGGIRKGICIDIGCGPGNLDVELARRSELTIIGVDIDADMQPLFERRMREAGLEDRVSFVEGDAQKLPFPDDYADAIVSRGTLTFIPDIAKCLQEVERVLKPTGVGFLGGRYLYTPKEYLKTTDELREIVRQSGVAGAKVVEERGQWVKIVGPGASEAASTSGIGPQMLGGRVVADYGITEGRCLLVSIRDGHLEQTLQRELCKLTDLAIVVLYPTEKVADAARSRIRKEGLDGRIECRTGTLDTLPLEDESVDLVVGVGPVLIWGDRQKKIGEIYRVLRQGGVALVGGQYRGMPESRRVSDATLRADIAATGIQAIRVLNEMGQWVEVTKGVAEGRASDEADSRKTQVRSGK